ncbi:unnamed protein product [Moneuplotes crassus]|uniref:Uncharacterized protein n=1 Tax=Euplotes crassus TaxID=5936 RepID=A0AAD1UHB3_EUPCR|nr:unnamed protein product [Moneuplotes crassus]
MKLIFLLLALAIGVQAFGATETGVYEEVAKPQVLKAWPWEFCSVRSAVTGFFTGTESDPDYPNSRCVTRFPDLQDQFSLVVNSVGPNLLIPTNFVAWLNTIVTLIVRYGYWQNYCVFSTLFTRLDNTIQNREGLITALSRGVFQSSLIEAQWSDFRKFMGEEDCFKMSRAFGIMFSVILDFNVPEDIV